ncbi:unnamed protein product [Staurois parvus]|uniref:Uncharacterized protein n=1 Tax=Staurois parvus TaxID=386267 RepID=A0ABN9DRH3_9NEOB|nr:unnamed protein product [Staurois parvus]
MVKCQGNMPSPTCSSARITANRTYRSKPSQNGLLTKMHEEEHHQQMSILQLQLIQMNEVHVAKVQQIERECEMAEVEHRIKMEILNKKRKCTGKGNCKQSQKNGQWHHLTGLSQTHHKH